LLVFLAAGREARQSALFHVAAARANRAPSRRTDEFDLAWVLAHEFKFLVTGIACPESGGLFVS